MVGEGICSSKEVPGMVKEVVENDSSMVLELEPRLVKVETCSSKEVGENGSSMV